MIAVCCDCGSAFVRDYEERWKVSCLPCWVRLKRASQEESESDDTIHIELAAQLGSLLMLCHPDKHGGSTLSTTITQWLLDVRDRLKEPAS